MNLLAGPTQRKKRYLRSLENNASDKNRRRIVSSIRVIPSIMKLSVIMPIYNERNTLRVVVERVLSVPFCVDDGSRDGCREILAQL